MRRLHKYVCEVYCSGINSIVLINNYEVATKHTSFFFSRNFSLGEDIIIWYSKTYKYQHTYALPLRAFDIDDKYLNRYYHEKHNKYIYFLAGVLYVCEESLSHYPI